jgi:hypothetical protein
MPSYHMCFDEPTTASELTDELSTFIKREIEPLEEDHNQFLGPTQSDISSTRTSSRSPSILT